MNDLYSWAKALIALPNFPSWLQAFAAIVALGISVWAGVRSTAIVRRRDRLELRGLAVAVYPEIVMLKTSVQNVRDGLLALKARDKNLVGQSVAASVQLTAQIQIPPMLDRNIDKLFILGELAGPSCLHLVRLLIQHNVAVDAIASRMMMLNAEQWIEAVDQLEDHLTLLDNVIAKCEHEVQPIHDSIKG